MLTQQNDGKEINLNLEDALISMESLRLMLGGHIVKAIAGGGSGTGKTVTIRRSEQAKVEEDNKLPKLCNHLTKLPLTAPTKYRYINLSTGDRGRVTGPEDTQGFKAKRGEIVRVMWEESKDGSADNGAVEITISPNTFAGTYRIVGDTFWRNENGQDKPFQFIIYKAETSVA